MLRSLSPRASTALAQGKSPRGPDQLDMNAVHDDTFWISAGGYRKPEDALSAPLGNVPSVNRTYDRDVFHEEVLHARFSPHLWILPRQKPAPPAPEPVVVPPQPEPAPVQRAMTPPPSTPLRIDGHPVEGQTLRAAGWFLTDLPHQCTFQWMHGQPGALTPINGAVAPHYVLTEANVGKQVGVQVTRTSPYGGRSQDTATSAIIQPLSVDTIYENLPDNVLTDLRISGGPYHTNPVTVTPVYSLGRLGPHRVQWQRCEVAEDGFRDIPHAHGLQYQPTADDLHSLLRCKYTVTTLAGQPVQDALIDVPPEFLTIEPSVARAVEQNVNAGAAEFPVNARENDGLLGVPGTLRAQKGKVAVTSAAGKSLLKANLTAVRCVLSTTESNVIRLDEHNTDADISVSVADRVQRDVLALTLRSFAGQKQLEKTPQGVHSTKSLADLRAPGAFR
eukprot:TRINITY_DN746_c0_g1_i1.p1 TRINITY_DN746_c0_g1~~TRINITY_DN746_c0_g1_i1.p1  ORF type:complete len:454 (-),score=79.92 TRINITY_DN746_c0_g1_i1:99-1439(-)